MPARYEQLASWVDLCGFTVGAELGLFDGRTFLHLLKACPQLTLYGVDVWGRPTPQGATTSGERCFCPYCSETRASRKTRSIQQMEADVVREAAQFDGRGKILAMSTEQAAMVIAERSLDFVFIDADHSTEGVARDIGLWLPKVRPGGLVIGHDANMKSVMAGVAQHFRQVAFYDDHVWVWSVPMAGGVDHHQA